MRIPCSASIVLAVTSSIMPAASALGDFEGIHVHIHTQATVNGSLRSAFRVYALCSEPGDVIGLVGGGGAFGVMVIETTNPTGNPSGGNFVNVTGGGATAPSAQAIGLNPEVAWDTFVTIGLAQVADGQTDSTGLTPGFANALVNVGSFNSDSIPGGAGWFVPGQFPQGTAANGIPNISGSGLWGVMLAQLTVNAGNHVRGTFGVSGWSGGQTFLVPNLTWTSLPGPSALPLLVSAGLANGKRRRC